jgi:hypothetical protein
MPVGDFNAKVGNMPDWHTEDAMLLAFLALAAS